MSVMEGTSQVMEVDDGLVIQPENQASAPYFEERRHREFMIKMDALEKKWMITEVYQNGVKLSMNLPNTEIELESIKFSSTDLL